MIHIKLYNYKGESARIDKTAQMTLIDEITGEFRTMVSTMNPTILFKNNNLLTFNYVYIEELSRYYYVTETRIVNTNLYEIALHEDVLQTFGISILANTAYVDRSESAYDPDLFDSKVTLANGRAVEVVELEDTPFYPSDITASNIVLETMHKGA